jgi:hypothetical protein
MKGSREKIYTQQNVSMAGAKQNIKQLKLYMAVKKMENLHNKQNTKTDY